MKSKTMRAKNGTCGLILQHAKGILDSKDNRLGLVTASLICLAASALFLLLFSIALLVVHRLPLGIQQYETAGTVLSVSIVFLAFWLAGPLYLGALRVAADSASGRRFSLARLFVFYSSFSLLIRAWRILSGAFYRLLFLCTSMLSVAVVFAEQWEGAEPWILIGAGVFLFLLWALLSTVSYPVSALAVSDLSIPIRAARHRGRALTRKHRWALAALRIELLLFFAASLLSVGVVTLFHVMPLMLAARISSLSLLAESGN